MDKTTSQILLVRAIDAVDEIEQKSELLKIALEQDSNSIKNKSERIILLLDIFDEGFRKNLEVLKLSLDELHRLDK